MSRPNPTSVSPETHRPPIATLFGFSFLTAATYVITRALGVSLYIARIGSDALPVVLVASAIAVIAISVLTRWLVQRIRIRRCVAATWAALGSCSLWLSVLLGDQDHSFAMLATLFVLAELRGCLNTVYVTTLVNDKCGTSRSKRPFVLVSSGAPLAGILAGALMSYQASEIRDTTWLQVIAVLDVMTIMCVQWLPKNKPTKISRRRLPRLTRAQDRKLARVAMAYRYRYGLAALVGAKVFALTLFTYQWNVAVGNYLPREEQLIAYFAAFYAINDVAIVLLQFTIATPLLDRFGIGLPLRAYPMLLGVLGLIAITTESPWLGMVLFTAGQGLNVMRRSLYDPGVASAYSILDPSIRRETIVLVKGMVKPFAEATAAVGLLFFARETLPIHITWIWMAALILWYWCASWVSRTYERAGAPIRHRTFKPLEP